MQEVCTIEELERLVDALPRPRLGVVGNPIAHSLSPAIQHAAMHAAGIDGSYVRILCSKEPGAFRELVERLRKLEFLGVNVTVPFKREARAVADEVDELSRLSGATNTLVFRDGIIEGLNTDGPGFVRALEFRHGTNTETESILILGACGGAGSALAMQCALSGCKRLLLANRPRPELEQLADKLRGIAPRLDITTYSLQDADQMQSAMDQAVVVVNATSLGLSEDDPPPVDPDLLRAEQHTVFDLITHDTALQRRAREKGLCVCDGRDMLVGQGALSFEKWFGVTADVKAMRAAINESAV